MRQKGAGVQHVGDEAPGYNDEGFGEGEERQLRWGQEEVPEDGGSLKIYLPHLSATGHWVFDKFNNGTYKCPALKPQSQQQQSAQPKKELDEEGTGIEQREDSVNLIQQEIMVLLKLDSLRGRFLPTFMIWMQ